MMEHGNIFSRIKCKLTANKWDVLAILFIFLISLFFLKNTIGTQTLMSNGHYLHEQTFFSYNYKAALEKGTLPFWTPYWYSGQPLFADSQVFFLNLTHLFIMLFGNIALSIGASTLTYFFIGGISMYFLVRHLTQSKMASIVSALIFMFNGLIYQFVTLGNPSILEPYSLMPLIFLSLLKAKKAENPLNHSILIGILLTCQLFSGGAIILTYTLLFIGLYMGLGVIGKGFKRNLLRALIIGMIFTLVFFGLSAIKLLPNFGFIEKTNREGGLSYQEYIGEDHFVFKDFFKVVVFNLKSESTTAHIGIAAFVLAMLSLAFWRKRMITSLLIIAIFILVLGSGGFLAKIFYGIPPFSMTRHIGRVLFIFVFILSVLAGYGIEYLSKLEAKRLKLSGKIKNGVFIAVALLILTELLFVKGIPKGFNVKEQLDQNELAKYLQQENEKFRITTFDVNDPISFFGSSYYAQYGLETLSGGGGLWINDFISYIMVAKNYNASKLYGILNLKYITSTKEVSISGFRLAKKFNECEACKKEDWTYWIGGPYLYENEGYLPRYYMVDNAVLVLGDDGQVQQMTYAILLNSKFDPKNAVLIQGKSSQISSYEIEFLKRFKAIVLLEGSVDSSSMQALEQYVKSGGVVFPNILKNENTINAQELEGLLSSFKGSLPKVSSMAISQNEIQLMPDKSGFLVLSEKLSLFDDWSANQDNKNIEIMRADNVISAVYVDSHSPITFKFVPKYFRIGAIISITSFFIIFIYGAFILARKWKTGKAAA